MLDDVYREGRAAYIKCVEQRRHRDESLYKMYVWIWRVVIWRLPSNLQVSKFRVNTLTMVFSGVIVTPDYRLPLCTDERLCTHYWMDSARLRPIISIRPNWIRYRTFTV